MIRDKGLHQTENTSHSREPPHTGTLCGIWAVGLGLLIAASAQASSSESQKTAWTTKSQRREWHTLSRDDKLDYINAEKCLMSKPAKLGLPAARTIFDEFQMSHVLNTKVVHGVGAFLPFHRLFIHAHEALLQAECNYTGGQPYWNESLDAGNFSSSIILDPEVGFGGNGTGPLNCIVDGPFKDYVNPIGPGQTFSDHCIDRIISDCASEMAGRQSIDQCMRMQNFSAFGPCLEGMPHVAGHGGIGGQMLNVFSSPGDPIFYLHHAYLDKLWWDWQSQNLTSRLTDIAGPNVPAPFWFPPERNATSSPPPFCNSNWTLPPVGTPNRTILGFPVGWPLPIPATLDKAELLGSDGDPGNETTLGHVLTMYGVVPNRTIAEVMDIRCGLLCYEYI
ncbi:Di-copper centre-containing protein [Lojkania enalia]|uniref:Di-copper centre-containing protein n=1 Tax=Lojkania enalia TaxID=147567 RepID=A0A9P4NBR3_9PLEO|nr:Di-copper centre-containing protein [Didymosphaeria enalia]